MTRLLLLLFLIPSLSFAAPNKVTGKFDNGDTVTINRNFHDQEQGINNRVLANPLTINSAHGTGAATATLGTNAPALLLTTPYTWFDIRVGTVTCIFPVWLKQ